MTMKPTFRSLALAREYADRGCAMVIVLGDDERFWVVTIREASRLMAAGYELAACVGRTANHARASLRSTGTR